jgi:hypothetical protein
MRKPTSQLILIVTFFISLESFSKSLPDALMDMPITLLSGDKVTLSGYQGNNGWAAM